MKQLGELVLLKKFNFLWAGNSILFIDLAPVVQKVDSAIRWINLYPVDSAIDFPNTYLLDSDLSSG